MTFESQYGYNCSLENKNLLQEVIQLRNNVSKTQISKRNSRWNAGFVAFEMWLCPGETVGEMQKMHPDKLSHTGTCKTPAETGKTHMPACLTPPPASSLSSPRAESHTARSGVTTCSPPLAVPMPICMLIHK